MHRKLLLAIAATLCFAPFLSLRAQDSKLLSLLRSKNREIETAMIAGDLTPAFAVMSPSVMITNPMGQFITRADLAQSIKSGVLKYTSITDSDEKLTQFHDVAVLTLLSNAAGSMQGHDISGKTRYTGVWNLQAGQWKLVAAQITPVMASPQ